MSRNLRQGVPTILKFGRVRMEVSSTYPTALDLDQDLILFWYGFLDFHNLYFSRSLQQCSFHFISDHLYTLILVINFSDRLIFCQISSSFGWSAQKNAWDKRDKCVREVKGRAVRNIANISEALLDILLTDR